MKLVIVESPVKGNTIQRFLSSNYRVLSCYGHIRDLPKGELGIDNDFNPKYVIPTKARKTVNFLKKEAEKAEITILATDEDREGEAIAWHLSQALSLSDSQRIVFHEITKQAIEQALKTPRNIDLNLVNAQKTRRILDRIVGYKLSPLLWKKVVKGLSAGRVQSVALRLIAEREQEIKAFNPEEYWTITAKLLKDKEFEAGLSKRYKKQKAENILKDLKQADYIVKGVDKKETKKNPFPPFRTSTLQQEAYQRFRFPAKMTMRIAQSLYEKGLTTYHRTDSLSLSQTSINTAKHIITKQYGDKYLKTRQYKTKAKGAQEAHEAIRPSYPSKTPEKLDASQAKLYSLIWSRFIASQMSEAVFDSTSVEIQANNYIFKAIGQILKFDGFLKVYSINYKENELPNLSKGDKLKLLKLSSGQHFTQPPPRYTDASLIKTLEENGIGRPSTYAPIISVIQDRNYAQKNKDKRFEPTEIGITVNDLLVNNFPDIVDIKFTAGMEQKLDKIAQGKEKWNEVIKTFYTPFIQTLEKKEQEIEKKTMEEKTDEKCEKCNSPMVIKLGRFGKFMACSNYPECKNTKSLNNTGIKCPKCNKGEIAEKRSKRGKVFYACNTYPDCDYALWDEPIKNNCPKCKALLTKKKSKIKCSECDYAVDFKPEKE